MTRLLALHSEHQALGASFGEVSGNEVVLGYGVPKEEYTAAQMGVGLVDLSYRDTLRLIGPDRVSFLHGMCTQDINGMPEDGVAYAAMLTAKGAMVSDVRVIRHKDELLLDLEPGMGARVSEFLNKYLISEDAEVQDVSTEWGRLGLFGTKASELSKEAGLVVFPAALPLPGAVEVWGKPGELGALFNQLRGKGAQPVGFSTLELLRIEAGVPRYGVDMGENTIPLEANLERALHYNKGCYIGQEVIARATFRGHMNRKLMGLRLGTANPAALTELRSGERKVGWVTSMAHSERVGENIALGYVHRDFLTPGTELDLAGMGAKAKVAELPFTRETAPSPGAD